MGCIETGILKMEENILPDVYPYLYLRTSGAELFGNDYQPDL
jgi:hypothetical protein